MNFDLKIIRRDTYNFLDMLSDVGGIESILITFMNFILSFWNYNHLENYMVSKLYQYKYHVQSTTRIRPGNELFIPTNTCNILHYLRDLLPNKLLCCCKRRKRGK